MALFILSYDAHDERDYDPLYKGLAEIEAVPVLESVWMFEVNNTSSEVREWVRKLLDDDDRIFVMKLKPQHEWASRNLHKGIADRVRQLNRA